jgi:Domain of unknown function (DUF4263)
MKTLLPFTFDRDLCRAELDEFKSLLDSGKVLTERGDLATFFRRSRHLTAFIGATIPDIGPANRLGYEFDVFGDFICDVVLGDFERQTFCAIELEDAGPKSVFQRVGKKATKEWGRRFEHGFSQLVDWFYAWDDHKSTAGFAKHFGHGHVRFTGMLVIGRTNDIEPADHRRLRFRTDKVLIDSHQIYCRTYDDLYDSLFREWQLFSWTSINAAPAPLQTDPPT